MPDELLTRVERYYTAKLHEHGPTHRGVDWSTSDSQELRLTQLLRVVTQPGSLLDYGCGYGALVGHLADPGPYVGFDVSEAMVEAARKLHPQARFTTNEAELEPVDYVVASGIFNVRAGAPEEGWSDYIGRTLDRINALARRGFAVNMLTSYSDPPLMRADLHYADPLHWFDHCKRQYARNVALLHDYDLYEFTLIVRKELP
jgi:SAM-dependent methyltransferase